MLKSSILLSAISVIMARAAIPTLGMSGDVRTGNQKKKVPHYPLGTFTSTAGNSHESKGHFKKLIAAIRKNRNIQANGTPNLQGSEAGFYQGNITQCLISRVPYQGMTVRKAVVYVKQWEQRT